MQIVRTRSFAHALARDAQRDAVTKTALATINRVRSSSPLHRGFAFDTLSVGNGNEATRAVGKTLRQQRTNPARVHASCMRE
jgi:hypothetical protein